MLGKVIEKNKQTAGLLFMLFTFVLPNVILSILPLSFIYLLFFYLAEFK